MSNLLSRGTLLLVITLAIALLFVFTPPLNNSAIEQTAEFSVAPAAIRMSTARPSVILPLPSITPPVADLEPVSSASHTVREGENLYRVAQRYGVTMMDILALNPSIPSNGRLHTGQTLNIPVSESSVDPLLLDEPRAPAAPPTIAPLSPEPDTDNHALAINGVPLSSVIVLPEDVKQRIRFTYQVGLNNGNDPHAFSKIGDCNSESPFYLARFDGDEYNLGSYDYLQPVIDYFTGSFERQGVAVWRGNHAWSVITSAWADEELCQPNESALACEYRLHRPSFVIIRLGTNEYTAPVEFEAAIRVIIEETIRAGIIPILGTKADLLEGEADTNNTILRRLADEYKIPLWDFALVARSLPDHGVDDDGYHMTIFYSHDYRQAEALERGHGLHNLTALMMLDAVWRAVSLPES